MGRISLDLENKWKRVVRLEASRPVGRYYNVNGLRGYISELRGWPQNLD